MVAVGNLPGHYSQARCCRVGRGEVLQSSHALHSPSGISYAVIPGFLPWFVCCKLHKVNGSCSIGIGFY